MSEFDDIFAAAASPAMLSVLGDQVTYKPRNGGTARAVTAKIKRRRDFRQDDQGLTNVDAIECLCLRDASDATYGGIDEPRIGDAILLDAETDPEQRTFAFTGIVTDITAKDWVLHFTRDIIFRQGGSDQTGKR